MEIIVKLFGYFFFRLGLVPRIINSDAQMAWAGLTRKRLAFTYWLKAPR